MNIEPHDYKAARCPHGWVANCALCAAAVEREKCLALRDPLRDWLGDPDEAIRACISELDRLVLENEALKNDAERPSGGKPTCVPPAGQSMGLVKINGHQYVRPVMKVAKVTLDGATCVVPLSDLYDVLDGGGEYMVKVETMSVREFARMAEFTGW